MLSRKILVVNFYFRRIVSQACHFKGLLHNIVSLLIAVARNTVRVKLNCRIYLLSVAFSLITFECIQCGPLTIDLILDNNMVKDAVEIQNIFDIALQILKIKRILMSCIFKGSQLAGCGVLIQVHWCLNLFLSFTNYVDLSFYLWKSDKRLLLQLFYPLSGRFDRHCHWLWYFWLQFKPFFIQCFLYLFWWNDEVYWLLVVLLVIVNALVHAYFIQIGPILDSLLNFKVDDIFSVPVNDFTNVITVRRHQFL